jgi:hypothetical protein
MARTTAATRLTTDRPASDERRELPAARKYEIEAAFGLAKDSDVVVRVVVVP